MNKYEFWMAAMNGELSKLANQLKSVSLSQLMEGDIFYLPNNRVQLINTQLRYVEFYIVTKPPKSSRFIKDCIELTYDIKHINTDHAKWHGDLKGLIGLKGENLVGLFSNNLSVGLFDLNNKDNFMNWTHNPFNN